MTGISYIDSARIRFHQDLHLRRRRIDCHRFLLIHSGFGEFHFPQSTLSVHSGLLLLLSPGERESHYRADEEVSYLYVEFDSKSALLDGPYRQFRPPLGHYQTLCALIESVHRERGKGTDMLLPAAVELALLKPADAETGNAIDPRIRRALHFIDQNIDQSIQVPELATVAGLSVPHFRRLFLHATDLSPKQYLIRERMLHARKILQTEGLRVGEVADLMHFENLFQFSNQYKTIHGHSPQKDRS